MKSVIDEIESNLAKYVENETLYIKSNVSLSGDIMNNELDEIERKRLKQEKANETLKELPEKSKWDVVDYILTAVIIILAILIAFGVCNIFKIREETRLRHERYVQEMAEQQRIHDEQQRIANLNYYDITLVDKYNRELHVVYPKEFEEVETITGDIKTFQSQYDDVINMNILYDITLDKLRDSRIDELHDKGIYVSKISDIKNMGVIQYYTEQEPHSEVVTYIIGCDYGDGTFLLIKVSQASTLITEDYIENYIRQLNEVIVY